MDHLAVLLLAPPPSRRGHDPAHDPTLDCVRGHRLAADSAQAVLFHEQHHQVTAARPVLAHATPERRILPPLPHVPASAFRLSQLRARLTVSGACVTVRDRLPALLTPPLFGNTLRLPVPLPFQLPPPLRLARHAPRRPAPAVADVRPAVPATPLPLHRFVHRRLALRPRTRPLRPPLRVLLLLPLRISPAAALTLASALPFDLLLAERAILRVRVPTLHRAPASLALLLIGHASWSNSLCRQPASLSTTAYHSSSWMSGSISSQTSSHP